MRFDRSTRVAGSMLALAVSAAISHAQPTTAPAALPAAPAAAVKDADPRPTPELRDAAIAAFDAGEYDKALPMLKDLAVRLRGDMDAVGPILERVRVCETQLGQAAVEGINAPRTPHPKPQAGVPYDLTLPKLGNFAYDAEKGGNLPADVTALDGATVRIEGFMVPVDESDKITKFVLVNDLFGCCFGQPPQLQHTAIVTCPPGKSVPYFPDRLSITGTLSVAEKKEDGFITGLFQITASSIRAAK